MDRYKLIGAARNFAKMCADFAHEIDDKPPIIHLKMYIIAGTLREFVDFCADHCLLPTEHCHVTRPEMLSGGSLPSETVVFTGTWRSLPQAETILAAAKRACIGPGGPREI